MAVYYPTSYSVATSVGIFSVVCLFVCLRVCLFVNTITSERVNIGWWGTVQKSRPSSNFWGHSPPGCTPPKCGVLLWRWENQRKLSRVLLVRWSIQEQLPCLAHFSQNLRTATEEEARGCYATAAGLLWSQQSTADMQTSDEWRTVLSI